MLNSLGREKLLKRFVKGIKWNMVASLISQGSVFAASVLAARLLGTKSFGELGIIQSTVGMLSAIAGAGLGVTATKYISEYRNTNPLKVGRILGLCSAISYMTSIFFALALIILSPYLATYSLNDKHIIEQLRVASVYILFFTLNGYQLGALIGFESFSKIAKINILQGVTSLSLNFILIKFYGLTGASFALGLTALLSWFYYFLALRFEYKSYKIKVHCVDILKEKQIITTFAIPAAISGIIGGIAVWSSNAILVQQNDGYIQMAIYNASNNFRIIIMFIPVLISRVASPILSNLIGENDNNGYRKLFKLNLLLTGGICLTTGLIICLFAPLLLKIYGKNYGGGWKVLVILTIAAIIEVIATALYQDLFVREKIWLQSFISMIWGIVLIGITYYSARTMGALGLGFAYMFAHICSCLLYLFSILILNKNNKEKVICNYPLKQ